MGKKTTKRAERRQIAERSKKDAPASDLGYSLQRTRFLARLLQAEMGETVCLEVFDDVRLLKNDGTIVAEEDKSTHGRNPIADRSVDLWKTLANWVNAAVAGHVEPRAAVFEIYVSQPSTGTFSDRFKAARTSEDARKALLFAKQELWGPGPAHVKREEVADTLARHVDDVFGDNFELAITIVEKLEIICGSGDQHADLKPFFATKLVSEDVYGDALRWAHGWIKVKLDRLLEQNVPAAIKVDEFLGALLNFIRHHDRIDFLRSLAGDPTEVEIDSQRFMTYVMQLEIVDADHTDIIAAVNDYLRATVDRTVWAERGDIDPTALLDFEKLLMRAWKNLKDQVLIEQKKISITEQGKLILLKCLNHNAQLNGLTVPSHFVPGSFHALANLLELGWHPNYKQQLKSHRANGLPEMGSK